MDEKTMNQKLEIVKQSRDCVKVELGRKTWRMRHCGRRMIRIKVYQQKDFLRAQCDVHKGNYDLIRERDEIVCACSDCPYHTLGPFVPSF